MPLLKGCGAVPSSRARVRLLDRACEGGWGKPSSARRCRAAGRPEKKRYSSKCLSPPSVASDLSSSSLLSNLEEEEEETVRNLQPTAASKIASMR